MAGTNPHRPGCRAGFLQDQVPAVALVGVLEGGCHRTAARRALQEGEHPGVAAKVRLAARLQVDLDYGRLSQVAAEQEEEAPAGFHTQELMDTAMERDGTAHLAAVKNHQGADDPVRAVGGRALAYVGGGQGAQFLGWHR